MSKRKQSTSGLRYLVLAIMLVAFSAVAISTSNANQEIQAQHLQH